MEMAIGKGFPVWDDDDGGADDWHKQGRSWCGWNTSYDDEEEAWGKWHQNPKKEEVKLKPVKKEPLTDDEDDDMEGAPGEEEDKEKKGSQKEAPPTSTPSATSSTMSLEAAMRKVGQRQARDLVMFLGCIPVH